MAAKSSGGGGKWLWLLLALALLIGGVLYFTHRRVPPLLYTTESAARGDVVKLVTATGTLNPVVNVTVGSQVSGRISRLYVDFNTVVSSNEVIAEIDPSTYQAAVEQADADLANARANLELQQVECNRSSDLFTNKLISASDYDTAVATLHEAEAEVKIKEASLNNAKVNLGYCKIVSPVDGVVILRAVELGQTVASSFSTPTIFQIANDMTKMQIDSTVAEADVGGVVEGQDVNFTVDAYPDRTFTGTVRQVRNSPTTVNNVVTYDCVIGVTNADFKLKPGMTANVSIIMAEHDHVLTVPNSALHFRVPDGAEVISNAVTPAAAPASGEAGSNSLAGGSGGPDSGGHHGGGHGFGKGHGEHATAHTVYILTGDAAHPVLKAVTIKTGITDGIVTEVTSGLDEGAAVVTGVVSTSPNTAGAPSGPFGGGFPRR